MTGCGWPYAPTAAWTLINGSRLAPGRKAMIAEDAIDPM
jgi:hypothetical protein